MIFTVATTLSSVGAAGSAEAQTPRDAIASECERVVRTFVELDGEGAQLTAAGQQKLTTLFTRRGVPSTDKVSVVSDDVFVGPIDGASNSRMRVGVEYTYLGTLTLAGASCDNKPGGLQGARQLRLVRRQGPGRFAGLQDRRAGPATATDALRRNPSCDGAARRRTRRGRATPAHTSAERAETGNSPKGAKIVPVSHQAARVGVDLDR